MSKNRNQGNQMIFLFKCILAIAYILMGIVIFFIKDNPSFSSYPQSVKFSFILLCIAYGAFRLYRALNEDKMEEE